MRPTIGERKWEAKGLLTGAGAAAGGWNKEGWLRNCKICMDMRGAGIFFFCLFFSFVVVEKENKKTESITFFLESFNFHSPLEHHNTGTASAFRRGV